METLIGRRTAIAMIAVLLLASTALGSPRVAEAGTVNMTTAGDCRGTGASLLGAQPFSGTAALSGYGGICKDYYLTCTYIISSTEFYCPNPGWSSVGSQYYLYGSSSIASQHNICDTWYCYGQVGSSAP